MNRIGRRIAAGAQFPQPNHGVTIMFRTTTTLVLGTLLCVSTAPALSATQSITGVTCNRTSCPRPLQLQAGGTATIQLAGQRLEALTAGEVVDATGRPVREVGVQLAPLARTRTAVRSSTTAREVTLTLQGGAARSGLQLRFATTSGRSVMAPLELSIVAAAASAPATLAPRMTSGPPTRSPAPTSAAEALPPRVSSANPTTIVLGPRESGSIDLEGTNLDKLTGAYVVDANNRLVYHVRAELEPGSTRRTVRLTVPDEPNQRGPFGTPMTIMVTDEPGSSTPTPARVEVRSTYDLYISSCSIEPLPTYGWYRGSITVMNHGINTIAASLSGGSTLVEYDTHPANSGYTVILVPGGGLYLAPGQSWTYEIGSLTFSTDPPPSTQSFRLRARDDERSHANNERSCSVQAHPAQPPEPPERPDLVVSQLTVTPGSGPPSTEFVVTVTVTNQGEGAFQSAPGAPVWATCTIPTQHSPLYLGDLANGQSQQFTLPITYPLAPGDKETTCTVDPGPDKVEESDESNNSRTASFVVTPPQE